MKCVAVAVASAVCCSVVSAHTFPFEVRRVKKNKPMAQRVPYHGPGCAHNGSFITLLSSASYMRPALCLREQMRRVGSICPLLLMYDDRMAGHFSSDTLSQLERAYGRRAFPSEL